MLAAISTSTMDAEAATLSSSAMPVAWGRMGVAGKRQGNRKEGLAVLSEGRGRRVDFCRRV